MMRDDVRFSPLVKGATTATSPNVESIMDQLADGTYYIPDYQRDSSQWDSTKKSLFIETLINNLTVPPLIVYPHDDEETGTERVEVVDGQQRLTTIKDYLTDGFSLAGEDEVEYADNVGSLIQKRRFSELPASIQKQIKRYTLNIIVLPKNLDMNLRLEIFRRINEAGVPLSPHDLRLAIFGTSKRVYFIRLAGVFDPKREGSKRMIEAAEAKYQLKYPWSDHKAWKHWWGDSTSALGQAPSQMFLYYVIARDLAQVETLISSEKTQQRLGFKYDRTTTSVLDLYCAQLQNEAKGKTEAKLLATKSALKAWFSDFENWFNIIKTSKIPKIPVGSSTKVALFIAAASQQWEAPSQVTEDQWELIQVLLTQGPAKIKESIGIEYPVTRGKWPGQKHQIEQTIAIVKKIR